MARFPKLTGLRSRHTGLRGGVAPTGPTINRGKGNNNAATPWEFISPVKAKFGLLGWDLASDRINTKAPCYISEERNSFTVEWHKLENPDTSSNRPLCWLNPPFTTITPWARKCAEEVQLGARILLLIPASVGTNYYWDWIVPYADVYSVGRMVFDDCYDKHGELITTPYPKDLILCHYDWSPDRCLRTGAMNTAEAGSLYRWGWQDGG